MPMPRGSTGWRRAYCAKGSFVTKIDVLRKIEDVGLVPVLRADSAERAIAIADAITKGGVPVLEVTMTVPGALEVMRVLVQAYGDRLLVGAGTVLDPETARACMLAGSQFIVSPVLNVKIIEMCLRYSIAVIPGALTPTEVLAAWEAGADIVKVFPCSAVGGAKYLRALHGPMPQLKLIPTGGVSLATAEEFLRAGALALGVGSDLVDTKAIAEGRPEVITETASKYIAIVNKVREDNIKQATA
jgi:2-dehydro-3-deoxyphosphogluconate aldolase / (4S)-4-hydroxy-2-oxoglutarate aldolase